MMQFYFLKMYTILKFENYLKFLKSLVFHLDSMKLSMAFIKNLILPKDVKYYHPQT